ncbi:MAG: DUF3119 family protein [Hydrococcus sp. SU_1_0]|nr:DUF3119 family protein [Hydrococcus sp. SU_1_0]
MITNLEAENSTEIIELAPDFKIPGFLMLIAVGFAWVSLWLGFAIAILGLFLTIQTVLIRLQFTDQALNVLRSGKIIRSFPYSDWLNWEIFWSPVPILFYFKEVKSIHFLPIIFNAKTLADCLHKHYPQKKN